MDLEKIRELLKVVAESGVDEVEIEDEGFKLVVRKQGPPAPSPPAMHYAQPAYPPPPPAAHVALPADGATAPAAAAGPTAAAEPSGHEVKAPIVGTFYSSPNPDAEPFVKVGDRVSPGQVLCIIEAMKLMNEIECEVAGTITEILVENAQPVQYDQPLFVVDKD